MTKIHKFYNGHTWNNEEKSQEKYQHIYTY